MVEEPLNDIERALALAMECPGVQDRVLLAVNLFHHLTVGIPEGVPLDTELVTHMDSLATPVAAMADVSNVREVMVTIRVLLDGVEDARMHPGSNILLDRP